MDRWSFGLTLALTGMAGTMLVLWSLTLLILLLRRLFPPPPPAPPGSPKGS
jgi:hypothetical protein